MAEAEFTWSEDEFVSVFRPRGARGTTPIWLADLNVYPRRSMIFIDMTLRARDAS